MSSSPTDPSSTTGSSTSWRSAAQDTRTAVIACGAGTDHLTPGPDITIDTLIRAYETQCEAVEALGGRVILGQPITAGQPRRHQERHRHRPGVELLAEFADVRNGAVSYAGDRHDQLSRHTSSVSTQCVGTVSYTPTAGVQIRLGPRHGWSAG